MSSTMSSTITGRSGKDTSIFDSPTFDKDLRIHVNQAVGSASISPGGRDVVLASQQGLHIIDLDSPFSPPRHLRHQTPWTPADVQWSPFASRYYWVVSTSNQRALVWNLELASLQAPIEHTLHAHSRAITDINFSPLQPDLLATCAVDAFVHCWDLRVSARPVVSFSDWFAGATQVKWNRRNPHIVASSHDKYLHIWDDRKGALPLKTIEAHQTKIYGIDWSRTDETKIVTCSLDRTIKVWDYEFSETEPERVINTPFPVWRARHTPFGNGVLAMPQRGDHDLHMYDCRPSNLTNTPALTEPNYRFTGHDEQVKEFLWRGRGNVDEYADSRDFQLVSWGADHELILHRMGDRQLQSIGFHKGMQMDKPVQLTRIGAPYKSFRDRPVHPGTFAENTAQGSGMAHPGTSPGMNKVPIPIAGGWADDSQMMTYSGIETRNARPQDNGLISWMKGVKFGKRKPSSPERQATRRLSIIADLHHPDSHNVRENLSDEIIHVGEKFTRVTVEEADVSNRHVKISLNGPWAAEEKLAFMQLCMDFPVDYPEKSVPWFHLDKASALSEEKVAELEGNLRKIATGYLIHRRGCIEGFLSYLTGERDLEDSISWLGLGGNDVIAPGEEAESSSDEEDGLLGDYGGSESQNLGMEGSVGSGIFSTNANVPLPRTCGALWAPNGQLICFMPPKEEPRSILQKFAVDDRNRNRGSREIFEGFGRLNAGQSESKSKSKPSTDAFEADDSDNSSEFSSSSSSSGSDEPEMFLRRFQPPSAWHGGSLRFPRLKGLRTHSTEGSIPTSNGLNKKAISARHKTKVKVIDVECLLPSKRVLGSEYLVYGDGETVCSHNAQAALRNGFSELADIWEFVGLILAKKVPLSMLSIPRQETDIRVLARRLLIPSQRNDSGLDLSFDKPEAVLHPRETALIKWGTHPFAGSWLIDTLFTHFENLADVQMLGMLSCIFAQSLSDDQRPTYEDLPQSMNCAAQLFDYFPDKETAFGFFEPIISVSDLSKKHRKSGAGLNSAGESSQDIREQNVVASEPVTPFYTGNTPPMPLSRASTHRSSAAPSLSTSPEHHRTSIPSATSSFAASVLARPFQLASSPPVRNRTSGEELSSSIPSQAGVNWNKNKPFNRSDSTIRRSFMSQGFGDDYDGSTTEDDESLPPQSRVKISLKNQDMFDDEGCSNVAFLDPNQSLRFAVYRAVYANMLGGWGLRMQQNEVDKLDGLLSNILTRTRSRDHGSQSTLTLGEVEDDAETIDSLGPQVVRCCMSCGEVDIPERRADRKCAKCGGKSHLLSCTICYQPIAGLYKVCLACGHSAHISCLAVLLESLSEDEKPECEAACGCACDENMAVGGEDVFGLARLPTFEEEVAKETGFRMLQPVGNSTILHRRGSVIEAKQSGRLRERTQQEPMRLANTGLRKTRTRSFGH
ncbi:WD40 repeat-like protein [Aureobasidium pullulans]|nr:WD40 repeat-like protein [Aureobasidium pullulans]